jgi:hypothetical protein
MNTNELIAAALKERSAHGITLYWDDQDPNNVGPAYRVDGGESGALEFVRWNAPDPRDCEPDVVEGYCLEPYFNGPDRAYLGPDQYGVYPGLVAV